METNAKADGANTAGEKNSGTQSSDDSTVSVQNVSEDDDVPEPGLFRHWVTTTLDLLARPQQEVTVRLVCDDEMRELNRQYRGQDKTTNVLSFQFDTPPGLNADDHDELAILGDIVISPTVTRCEARRQSKQASAHFAHLCVHGVLHLCGYDHETDADADKMQGIESALLQRLGYPDPWLGDTVVGEEASPGRHVRAGEVGSVS